jgi:hypothetical protein
MDATEYNKIVRTIREEVAKVEPNGETYNALKTVTEALAAIYAGTVRFPDKGHTQIMTLAGF